MFKSIFGIENNDKMYDPRRIVGDFFEQRVMELFGLIRTDVEQVGDVPDLVSRDGSFFVEVKASSHSNGGVINKSQLCRFDDQIDKRRFYAFAYHPIAKHMARDYPTKEELRDALEMRSLFLFPFSVTKAYFEASRKKSPSGHDVFVQLKESDAKRIFYQDNDIWNYIGLRPEDYSYENPHELVYIVTSGSYLKDEILYSLDLKLL